MGQILVKLYLRLFILKTTYRRHWVPDDLGVRLDNRLLQSGHDDRTSTNFLVKSTDYQITDAPVTKNFVFSAHWVSEQSPVLFIVCSATRQSRELEANEITMHNLALITTQNTFVIVPPITIKNETMAETTSTWCSPLTPRSFSSIVSGLVPRSLRSYSTSLTQFDRSTAQRLCQGFRSNSD